MGVDCCVQEFELGAMFRAAICAGRGRSVCTPRGEEEHLHS